MDELNEMMESRGLPRDLRARQPGLSDRDVRPGLSPEIGGKACVPGTEVRMRRYMHECVVAKQQKMQEPSSDVVW